jgi:hypothetical protein
MLQPASMRLCAIAPALVNAALTGFFIPHKLFL